MLVYKHCIGSIKEFSPFQGILFGCVMVKIWFKFVDAFEMFANWSKSLARMLMRP